MPTEQTHHASGTLPMVAALAAAAGFVDAFVFQNVTPVFIANMSGNLVRLGMSAGVHDGHQAVAALVALAGFAAGVAGGAARIDSHVRSERPPNPSALLLFEGGLLIVLTLLVHGAPIAYSPATEPADYPVILIGAAAMGCRRSHSGASGKLRYPPPTGRARSFDSVKKSCSHSDRHRGQRIIAVARPSRFLRQCC